MYKKAFPIDKNILMQALKGGVIGGGLGGLGLGGLTYLTDSSEDPEERNARLRNSALMGMGLGGGIGAAAGGLGALPQEVVDPFKNSPVYKFLRGLTSKSDVANAGALTGATQARGWANNAKDKKFITEAAKGDKLNFGGLLGQTDPLEQKGSISDPDKLKKSLEGFVRGTKGKNPGGVGNIVDGAINSQDKMTDRSIKSLDGAKNFVDQLVKRRPSIPGLGWAGFDGSAHLSDTGLSTLTDKLHIPEGDMAAGRAANPRFNNVLDANREHVLGPLHNQQAGGLLDRIWDKTVGKMTGNTVGTYNDQIAGTAGRKPFGAGARGLGTFGLGLAGSKAMNAVAPDLLDPLMSDVDADGNNILNQQIIQRYNKARGN